MWLLSLLFIIPGALQLLDGTAPAQIAIIWILVGACFNPRFEATDRRRIQAVCLLFCVFAVALFLNRAGDLTVVTRYLIDCIACLILAWAHFSSRLAALSESGTHHHRQPLTGRQTP